MEAVQKETDAKTEAYKENQEIFMLHRREIHAKKDFYQRALNNMIRLQQSLVFMLNTKTKGWFESQASHLLSLARMSVEQDGLEAKIPIQKYHLKLYEQRCGNYEPVFEKESTEANTHFEDVWNEALPIARKHLQSRLTLVLDGYPKDNTDQELKNETYKAIKREIKSYKEQEARKNKIPHTMHL